SRRLATTYTYQPNAGIAAARHAAILQSRAPLLALHDDDDEPAPDYLERCLEFHRVYPDEADILLARVTPHRNLRHTPLLDWIFDPNDGLIGYPSVGVHDHWRFYGGTSSCKRSLYRFGLHDPEDGFGPILPQLLQGIHAVEPLEMNVPASFIARHKGQEYRGVDALHASYTLCAAYARALGWRDYNEETPEKRGLRRIETLLDDYYYETPQGQRVSRSPRGRGAIVCFHYTPDPADSGDGQCCMSLLR